MVSLHAELSPSAAAAGDLTYQFGAVDTEASPGATTLLTLSELSSRGNAPAVITGGRTISYRELAELVRQRAELLGTTRRLVLLGACNELDPLLTYLAALVGNHVVLLAPGCDGAVQQRKSLREAWLPDVIHRGGELVELHPGTSHDLHPDLAVLLSTSGSTGSPKLVRLSASNVRSNAEAIASYLGLTDTDRAITTLPFHYCYGLSVINSHLLAGASLVLNQRSVVEDEFWAEFEAFGATSFAGVPYTFELLAASGFARRVPPTLRQITQAGGRLAPDTVRSFAALGRESGFDLIVMYGQTEATARMAYLPPHLAAERAETIGVPIPGGHFRIEPVVGPEDAGELVYTGDNVMLGYAERPTDLALGRQTTELRTGDLARQRADGLFEIVGRLSRFAKVYGLRLDLDRIEDELGRQGIAARVVAHDDRLKVFVRLRRWQAIARRKVAAFTGLPEHAIGVHRVATFPKTASGKPDRAALERHAAQLEAAAPKRPEPLSAQGIRNLYAELLGRPDASTDDSFVSLRGDSLSYVEVSIWLAETCGDLPADWAIRTCHQLATSGPARRRSGRTRVETALVLRALAIVLIVGSHADLFNVQGGAHLLLALVGFNLARFQLASAPRQQRVRSLLHTALQVFVPSALWIGAVGLLTGAYRPATALMLNQMTGPNGWTSQWQFWFLEVLIWSVVGIAALLEVPPLERLERRWPFGFALGLLALALTVRLVWVGIEAGATERYSLAAVFPFLVLGWLIARATSVRQRLMVSLLMPVTVLGFFDDPRREAVIMLGLLLVTWLPRLTAPRLLVRAVGTLAAASLFIYLTHWQVYPELEQRSSLLATLAALVIGICAWKAWTVGSRRVVRAFASDDVGLLRCWRPPGLRTRLDPDRPRSPTVLRSVRR